MGIRKEIFICAAALSIMACTACGSSEGNVSGTNGVETSTGVESGMIEQPQVMYDGYIYYYNATGRDEKLPEGYEIAGTIKKGRQQRLSCREFCGSRQWILKLDRKYISAQLRRMSFI